MKFTFNFCLTGHRMLHHGFIRPALRALRLPNTQHHMNRTISSLSASLMCTYPHVHPTSAHMSDLHLNKACMSKNNCALVRQIIRSMSVRPKTRQIRKTPYREMEHSDQYGEATYVITEPYEEGTVTLYRSHYPRAMRYLFVLLAFILVSHYAMIPELAKAETFNMGLIGWTAAASVETAILVGVLHMFARRYVRSISCNIVNPTAFPDSLTLTVSNFLGNPQQIIVPVRDIVGLTKLSRASAHKDALVHLEIVGLNNNMYFARKGWYHENTDILDAVFNYKVADLMKEK